VNTPGSSHSGTLLLFTHGKEEMPSPYTYTHDIRGAFPERVVEGMSRSAPVEGKGVPQLWLPGDIILDTYEVLDEMGGDASGRLLRVRHGKWNIDMVVRTITADISETARNALLRECDGWIELGLHPHVATCYYVRELGGRLRVFSEFVEGGSLSDWMRSGKIISLPMALEWALQCLGGLSHAHRRGMVHGDLKPARCMMTTAGRLKITDFFSIPPAEEETAQGALPCDTSYMPPERGDSSRGNVGPWSDIYSLGIMLFELCCGERPFDGKKGGHGEPGSRHDESPIPSPSEIRKSIPERLSHFILRCLAGKTEERYGNADEAQRELMAIYGELTGKPYRNGLPPEEGMGADSLNQRALAFLDLGKIPEALKCLEEALELVPFHAESAYNRSLVLWRRGALGDEQCIAAMEEVRKASPGDFMADYLTALVHMERGDFGNARAILGGITGSFEGCADVQEALSCLAGKCSFPSNLLRDLMISRENISASACWRHGEQLLFSTEKFMAGEGETMPVESWDTRKATRARIFGVPNQARSICLSGDENFVAASSLDTTVDIWEVESGRCACRMEGHSRPVGKVVLSADDHYLLSLGTDSTLRLWDLVKKECMSTMKHNELYPWTLAVTSDFRYAFTTTEERSDMGTILQWDLTRGRLARRLPGHTRVVNDILMSPDGTYIISASQDGTIRIWNFESGATVKIFSAPKAEFQTLAMTGDCRSVVSGDTNGAIAFWDFETGRIRQVLEGHTRLIRRVLLMRGDKFVVSLSEDGSLKVWDRAPGAPVAHYQGAEPGAHDVAAMKDEERLLVSEGGKFKFWEIRQGRVSRNIPIDTSVLHRGFIRSIAAGSDSFFTGSDDGTVKMWSRATGEVERTLKAGGGAVRALSFSEDRNLLGSGGEDGSVTLWDTVAGLSLKTFTGHELEITSLVISDDGSRAFSGSADSSVREWDLDSGECMQILEGHAGPVNALSLSSDGSCLVSGGADTEILHWDLESGKPRMMIHGHEKPVRALMLSRDGYFLASAGADRSIRIWEMATGRCVRTYRDDNSEARSLCISGDGQRLLSVCSVREVSTIREHLRIQDVTFMAGRHESPFMLSRIEGVNKSMQQRNLFTGQVAEAAAALERKEFDKALATLRKVRALPWFSRRGEAMKLWSRLYMVLPRKSFIAGLVLVSKNLSVAPGCIPLILPGGVRVAVMGQDGRARPVTLIEEREVAGACEKSAGGSPVPAGQEGSFIPGEESAPGNLLTTSRDGRHLLSSHEGGALQVSDLVEGISLYRIEDADCTPECCAFSRYGRTWSMISTDGRVHIHDTRSGEVIGAFRLAFGRPGPLQAFTPDCRVLITGVQDDRFTSVSSCIQAYDIYTGRLLFHLEEKELNALQVSADGRYLAYAAGLKVVVRDLDTRVLVREFTGHHKTVRALCFTDDSRYICTGSDDHTVRVWEIETGSCCRVLEGHGAPVISVGTRPDAQYLTTLSGDGEVKVWLFDWELSDQVPPGWGPETDRYLKSYAFSQFSQDLHMVKEVLLFLARLDALAEWYKDDVKREMLKHLNFYDGRGSAPFLFANALSRVISGDEGASFPPGEEFVPRALALLPLLSPGLEKTGELLASISPGTWRRWLALLKDAPCTGGTRLEGDDEFIVFRYPPVRRDRARRDPREIALLFLPEKEYRAAADAVFRESPALDFGHQYGFFEPSKKEIVLNMSSPSLQYSNGSINNFNLYSTVIHFMTHYLVEKNKSLVHRMVQVMQGGDDLAMDMLQTFLWCRTNKTVTIDRKVQMDLAKLPSFSENGKIDYEKMAAEIIAYLNGGRAFLHTLEMLKSLAGHFGEKKLKVPEKLSHDLCWYEKFVAEREMHFQVIRSLCDNILAEHPELEPFFHLPSRSVLQVDLFRDTIPLASWAALVDEDPCQFSIHGFNWMRGALYRPRGHGRSMLFYGADDSAPESSLYETAAVAGSLLHRLNEYDEISEIRFHSGLGEKLYHLSSTERGLVVTLRAELLNHRDLVGEIILPDIRRTYRMHLADPPLVKDQELIGELMAHRDITGKDSPVHVLVEDLAAAGFGVRNSEIAAMRLKALIKKP